VPPARTGARHAAIAPYGPFRAGDGQVVYLGIQNEREWMRFCEVVLGRPELAADSRFGSNALRVEHQYALEAIIIAVFAERTGEQVVAALDGAGIANARMNTMAEFLDHPQLRERNRWRDIASPAGPLRALLPPFDIEGVEPAMGSVPSLGEHTDAILRELGFEPAVIARWRQERVI
jgi:crotonobetainyl-CoA:carnitine CoA-transferase CaiB-like acyl-CoA transferase